MAMIFSFSSQNGTESGSLSYRVSYKIVDAGSQLLNKDLEPWQKDAYATKIEGPVRKAAHITEYFILAITVALPLYVYGLRGFPLLLVAGALCVGFACTDEYHQSFVSGRSPSVRDVCIDSIGVFFGIMLVPKHIDHCGLIIFFAKIVLKKCLDVSFERRCLTHMVSK